MSNLRWDQMIARRLGDEGFTDRERGKILDIVKFIVEPELKQRESEREEAWSVACQLLTAGERTVYNLCRMYPRLKPIEEEKQQP